jgi:hypothetical protein
MNVTKMQYSQGWRASLLDKFNKLNFLFYDKDSTFGGVGGTTGGFGTFGNSIVQLNIGLLTASQPTP